MIKSWGISLVLSAVCFGILALFEYLIAKSNILWIFFLTGPITFFVFIFFFILGSVTFIAGVIGVIRYASNRVKFIVLTAIILVLFIVGINFSHLFRP